MLLNKLSYDRKQALKAGYKASQATPDVLNVIGYKTLKSFKKSLKDWFVFGVERSGKCIGMGILKTGEIHFCISPEYQGRWLTKSILKQINQLPITHTTVSTGNLSKQKFVEKIGFNPIRQLNGLIIYELNQLKHG